ncbi:SDR family oxidoreductase [Peribacillus muralis]|uniref:SDR family NAD(P)-dependent oxidoreductase n=1 Tax=Peribacillus muralis TaxID=264697 RepID=UPI001F4D6E29|nr:SDR family NAD(P)-dependent oxidoreductase [Peribacillus muralis]MCK1992948.1 SDR family oxidoreductase [Peribacillus muralis]MCK2013503.1 SDR family oxidoreductase [Peribacillus muralis]
MDLGLTGKSVVITGGTTGIGKAIANILLQEGCHVTVSGRNKEKGNSLIEEFTVLGHNITYECADASKSDEVGRFAENAVKRYGSIDVWINNAGIYPQRKLLEMTEEEWDEVMHVNLKSVWLGSKVAAGYMRQGKGGVILNAASFASILPSAGSGAYAASKAGILSMTRTLAAELAPHHIRVNAYIPGVIETPMTESNIEKNQANIMETIALRKLGKPEDIAHAVAFMASNVSSYMTGTHMEISGGKFCVQNPMFAWKEQ